MTQVLYFWKNINGSIRLYDKDMGHSDSIIQRESFFQEVHNFIKSIWNIPEIKSYLNVLNLGTRSYGNSVRSLYIVKQDWVFCEHWNGLVEQNIGEEKYSITGTS